jgi:hypothetical protein
MANKVTSKVNRIYTRKNGCYIRLENPGHKPKDGYFWLSKKTDNYNSLYSLVLIAAVNRYDLHIRTEDDIVSTAHANVEYLLIDW